VVVEASLAALRVPEDLDQLIQQGLAVAPVTLGFAARQSGSAGDG
jgi:hypothetical protein